MQKIVEFLMAFCVIFLLNQKQKSAFVFPNNDESKTCIFAYVIVRKLSANQRKKTSETCFYS